MRTSISFILFAATACSPYPDAADEEHTDGSVFVGQDYYTVQPAPEGFGAALGSALDRWARATCLPLSVGTDGLMTLRSVEPGSFKEKGKVGQTVRHGQVVSLRIQSGMAKEWTAAVTTHEMYHALALRDDHTEAGLCQTVLNNPHELLDSDCLERVCAVNDCRCFVPE